MPLTPPRTLQALITGDSAASRALQNVKTAVDPLLLFVNGTFQVVNDGTLNILRRIKTFTADTINGTTVNAKNVQAGSVTSTSVTTTSVTSFGPIVSTQSISGQSVSGSGVSSGAGFKADRDVGYVYASSAVANTRYQTKRYTGSEQGGSLYNALVLFQPIFPGSIVGIQCYSLGNAGGTYQVALWKSAVLIPTSGGTPFLVTPANSAAQYTGAYQTFTKGQYPFVAADYFSISVTYSTAGNQHVQVMLTLEYTA